MGLVEVALLVGLGYRFGQSATLAHEIRWLEVAVAVALVAVLVLPLVLKPKLARKHRREASA